jgi:hypothetical protein
VFATPSQIAGVRCADVPKKAGQESVFAGHSDVLQPKKIDTVAVDGWGLVLKP